MFNLFKKKEASLSETIRETLFGDMPHSQWPPSTDNSAEVEPWSSFINARNLINSSSKDEVIEIYKNITEKKDLESRHYLQAWHFLRQLGVNPSGEEVKKVYGVVVEVQLAQGLDVLAAYSDFTARYYNFSGAGVVWERPNASLDDKINDLLISAKSIVEKTGSWDKPRPAVPPRGQARLNMLTPDGLYFAQGSLDAFAKDGLTAPVIQNATELMQKMTQLGK